MKLTPSDAPFDQQSGIRESWNILVSGWPIMLLSLIAVVLAAGVYYLSARSEFEATLTISVGEIATSTEVRNIASVNATAAIMKAPEFIDEVVELLGWKDDERGILLENSYSVYPVTSSDRYVRLRVRGYSVDDARRAGEVAFSRLSEKFEETTDRIETENASTATVLTSDISDLESLLEDIRKVMEETISPTERIQLQKTAIEVGVELRALRLNQRRMVASVDLRRSVRTTSIQGTAIPEQPIHPDKSRVAVLAAFVGFFVGVLLIAARTIFQAERGGRADVQQNPRP